MSLVDAQSPYFPRDCVQSRNNSMFEFLEAENSLCPLRSEGIRARGISREFESVSSDRSNESTREFYWPTRLSATLVKGLSIVYERRASHIVVRGTQTGRAETRHCFLTIVTAAFGSARAMAAPYSRHRSPPSFYHPLFVSPRLSSHLVEFRRWAISSHFRTLRSRFQTTREKLRFDSCRAKSMLED